MKNTPKIPCVDFVNNAVSAKPLVNDGKFRFRPAGLFSVSAAVALVALGVGAGQVQAASATWSGATSGVWASGVTGNWAGGVVPGNFSGGTNIDVATFNNNVNTAVTLSAYTNIGGITFDTANAGAFTISSGSLGLSTNSVAGASGVIYVGSTVTAAETINSPMILRGSGTASFINDAVNSSATLNINGSVTTGAGINQFLLSGGNTGNNTFSGGLSLASSPIVKSGVGTWIISGTNTFGALTVNSGLLVLAGTNTSSGATTISSGTLQVGNGGTVGNLSSGNVTNNGSLVFNRSSAITVGSLITGTGTLTQSGNGNLTLTAANTYTGSTIINSGTLTLGNLGVLASSGSIALNGGALWASVTNISLANSMSISANSVIHTADAAGSLLTLSGTISGNSKLGINFHNGGSVALTSDLSQFNGTLSLVNSGTLNFLSNTTVIATGTNTTLDLGSAGVVLNTFSGSHPILFGALQGGTGSQLLGTTTAGSAVITYSIGSLGLSSTFAGIIANGSGAGSSTALTITGGNQILTGANTYTGATTISGGTLQIGNSGTTGSLSTSSAITNNGTLVFNRTNAVVQGTDFANTISGSGGLTQAGSGTLTLGGANTYTGRTSVNGGSLALANSQALGTSGTISFGGGTLRYSGNNTVDYSARIKGSLGAIAIDTNGQSVSFASALDSSNTGGLTKSGSGNLTLSGNNTYTGDTAITGGTLTLNGSIAASSAVSVNSATLAGSGTANGSVTVNNATVNGNGLKLGAATFTGTSTLSGNASASSLTVDSGTTSVTGAVTTTGNLSVSVGATVNNTNSITANTVNVSNGATLTNNGTVHGAVNVTGLLNGTGTIQGALTIKSTGELSPGNSPGVTTVTGALVVESGAKVSMQIDGLAGAGSTGGYDQIVVTSAGSVTLDSGSILNLTLNATLPTYTTITLIDNESASAIIGKFTEVTIGSDTYDVSTNNIFTYNGQQYALSYTATSGADGIANDLTLTVVPEPSTWAMMVGGLGLLAFGQRLRKRQNA